MSHLERLCETITSRSGVPRNVQIIIDQSLEPLQFLKTISFAPVAHFTAQLATEEAALTWCNREWLFAPRAPRLLF